MPVAAASTLVSVLELYLIAGAAVAVAFVTRGVNVVDPRAAQAGWGFRLLITPGVVLLWPLLAARWVRVGRPS